MSPWIDEQYIHRIGYKLDRFKKIRSGLYQTRCPICSDSQKRKDLARGYFIQDSDGFHFFCHNCGASLNIYRFLKLVDPLLCDEYSLDIYKEKNKYNISTVKEVIDDLTIDDIPKARLLVKREVPSGLKSLDELSSTHPALQYINSRKIPKEFFSRLFYTPKYRLWNSPHLKRKYDDRFPDHPRLVIPYYWFDKSIFRYAARSFGKESPRYQQTIIDTEKPRVFGLDRTKEEKLIYILEGQIDSLFLPNAIAVGSANYSIPILNTFEQKVFVPDNQPRNPDVVKQFKKLVDSGESVCIWKEDYGKDINNMVIQHNLSQEDLVRMISECTYSGVEAMLKFQDWRRC